MNADKISKWLSSVISSEEYREGDINYIFCDDEYLLKLNMEFLKHETLTDIISFDYKVGKELHGDVFISIERVKENAEKFEVSFEEELNRVLVHGLLHYCGYKDKVDEDTRVMREREDHYLRQLHQIS
jgi:rRNA maturation RNase YbeY